MKYKFELKCNWHWQSNYIWIIIICHLRKWVVMKAFFFMSRDKLKLISRARKNDMKVEKVSAQFMHIWFAYTIGTHSLHYFVATNFFFVLKIQHFYTSILAATTVHIWMEEDWYLNWVSVAAFLYVTPHRCAGRWFGMSRQSCPCVCALFGAWSRVSASDHLPLLHGSVS